MAETAPTFRFPFVPYEIQLDFMNSKSLSPQVTIDTNKFLLLDLYSCLENGKLGIFESPTGTVFFLQNSILVVCGCNLFFFGFRENH